MTALCGPASAAPVPAKPSIVTVPFDYDPILRPYIVVQASINGQPPLPFIVDTGVSNYYLVIEPWAAKRLNLPIDTAGKSGAVLAELGQYVAGNTRVEEVQISGVSKGKDLKFEFKFSGKAISDTNNEFKVESLLAPLLVGYPGPRLAGIIPCDLLSFPGQVWQIDYQHKLLSLITNSTGLTSSFGPIIVPLENESPPTKRYHLRARVGPSEDIDFLLDTGNFPTRVSHVAALQFPVGQSGKLVQTLDGRFLSSDIVLAQQLQISDTAEPDVMFQESGSVLEKISPNLIGNEFLSRFLVTLDLPHNKMYLKRRLDYARLILPSGQANVRPEARGTQYIAAWVKPGSPADHAGLHSGDQITSVDGQPLQGVPESAAQFLLDGQEGTSVKLKVLPAGGTGKMLSFIRSKKFLGRRHALLGVTLEWVQGYLMVSVTTPGSPLDQTLKYNDDIYTINDQPVAKMTMDEAFDQLERPDLALQVWRSSDKTWQEVHIAPLPLQTQVLAGPPPTGTQYHYYDKAGWTAVPLP